MAFDFHKDRKAYFDQQTVNAEAHVLPFIEKHLKLGPGVRVMEVGCGEGGVLRAFYRKGCECTGVELVQSRADDAKRFLAEEIAGGSMEIICSDIFEVDFRERFRESFDLIVLKDVIEHIHGQETLLIKLRELLKPCGKIFFGFPPWQMPFGGHQQIAQSKFLSRLPYYHLLPKFLYKTLLNSFNQNPRTIEELLEIKQTGISIERFERIVRRAGYDLLERQLYLVNPIYQYKFGLKPRRQFPVLAAIPWLRNFVTTAAFYLVEKK